jgi:hypothetical protein
MRTVHTRNGHGTLTGGCSHASIHCKHASVADLGMQWRTLLMSSSSCLLKRPFFQSEPRNSLRHIGDIQKPRFMCCSTARDLRHPASGFGRKNSGKKLLDFCRKYSPAALSSCNRAYLLFKRDPLISP